MNLLYKIKRDAATKSISNANVVTLNIQRRFLLKSLSEKKSQVKHRILKLGLAQLELNRVTRKKRNKFGQSCDKLSSAELSVQLVS